MRVGPTSGSLAPARFAIPLLERLATPVADGSPTPRGLGPVGHALFMTAMKDELGLRFTREDGPAEYWIVERIELPTES